jgi:MFS family permease
MRRCLLLCELFHLGRRRGMSILTNDSSFPEPLSHIRGQSYGVYLADYLSNGVFPEATSIDFALIGGFNFSVAMLVAPVVTIVARRYGTQAPMCIGVVLLAIAFISASFSHRIWQLYLSQGVLVGLGVGFTYIPSIAIISQWFHKRRSLANGISAAGSGIGGLIFSFMTEAVIRNISLAWSFRLTAIISCSMLFIATLLIRNRNDDIRPPQRGFDTKLLRRTDVLLLLAWSFISTLGYITLLYSLPDFARSINLSKDQAAAINAFLNLGTAVGRPLIGIVSDRFGRIEISGLLTFLCGLTCFIIWLPANSYGVIILFALVNGAILGVFWVVSHQTYPLSGSATFYSAQCW